MLLQKSNNAKDLDIARPMYNLIENTDNYSETTGLWEYHKDEPKKIHK